MKLELDFSRMREKELEVLDRMCREKEMSREGVLRMGLRLLDLHDHMSREGFTELQFATRDGRIYRKPPKLLEDEDAET